MMFCTACNSEKSRVIDVRPTENGPRRRRECKSCGERFFTQELNEDLLPSSKGHETAFPIVLDTDHAWHSEGGLTKREYFAGLALQGLCSANCTAEWSTETHARYSVKFADALLEALSD